MGLRGAEESTEGWRLLLFKLPEIRDILLVAYEKFEKQHSSGELLYRIHHKFAFHFTSEAASERGKQP